MAALDAARRRAGMVRRFQRAAFSAPSVQLIQNLPGEVRTTVLRHWPRLNGDEPVVIWHSADDRWAAVGLTSVAWGKAGDVTSVEEYGSIVSIRLKCEYEGHLTPENKLNEDTLVLETSNGGVQPITVGSNNLGAFWTMLAWAVGLYQEAPAESDSSRNS
jgi:hypothetical protein